MNAATRRLLEDAVREHRAGRIDVAADAYRRVLARERNQVDALHLLGVVERDRAVDLARVSARRARRPAGAHDGTRHTVELPLRICTEFIQYE